MPKPIIEQKLVFRLGTMDRETAICMREGIVTEIENWITHQRAIIETTRRAGDRNLAIAKHSELRNLRDRIAGIVVVD